MFDPLIKLALSKLDPLIDAYLERQRIILMIAGPGTLLFLLLFWAFSGAGGLMLFLGLLLVAVEAVLAGGIYLLNEKHRDEIREWLDAADAIEAFLTNADVFSEWKTFLATPSEDRRLEQLRKNCINLPTEYPPEPGCEYCGQEGLDLLETYVKQLRVGVATKASEDFGKWWVAWRAGREERNERKAERRGKSEAKAEAKAKAKAEARAEAEEKAAAKQAAADAEARQAAEAAPVQPIPTLAPEQEIPEPIPARKAQKRSRQSAKAAKKQAKKTAKITAKKAAKKRTKAKATQRPSPELSAGLGHPTAMVTEAAAIQEIMDAGFTAHDYDRKQEQIIKHQGRVPAPAEVVRGLMTEQKQRSKGKVKGKAKGKRRATRKVRVKVKEQSGGKVRWMRVVVVLAAIAGAPFAAWRIPQYESDPIVIIGEVRYEVLDRPDEIRHQLRTPFEELFGNKPVTLVDGRRIYVSEADYKLCWPESWDAIYEKNYTMRISAKARPLYLNDYSVAEVKTVERIDNPMAHAR
ncbi:MAG: hypothetical protein ACYTGF_04840 [Planctomycetota bacterium]